MNSESCQKLVSGEPHWDGVSKLLAVKESSLGLMFWMCHCLALSTLESTDAIIKL